CHTLPHHRRVVHSFPHDALPISRGLALRRNASRPCRSPAKELASSKCASTNLSRWTHFSRRSPRPSAALPCLTARRNRAALANRSEEHTSELQSPYDLVCRLLLE